MDVAQDDSLDVVEAASRNPRARVVGAHGDNVDVDQPDVAGRNQRVVAA